MDKYIYNEQNELWYELQGDYYLPCLKLPEEEAVHIGIWGQRHRIENDKSECSSLPVKKLYDHLKWHKRLCSWQTKKEPPEREAQRAEIWRN